MTTYNTLSEATDDLKKRGYTEDFSLQPHSLTSSRKNLELHPEDFEVVEMHRFEGESSTDDSAVVFAILSKDGIKGVLVDAYGTYSEEINPEMAKKLRKHS